MYSKVVIIGAPRSGTNMLRNMLVKLKGVETWPCDEINYIWRHGNKNFESDEFTPQMATPAIKKYINKEFDKFAHASNAEIVVEKTCASSMRVGFVNEVLPDAKFIFIVRDGIDTVASAKIRWKADLDIPYLLKKARYVPLSDFPYYAFRYLKSRLYRLISKEKRVSFWGPQMNEMSKLLSQYSLTQVCALQWLKCVENSERDLSKVDSSRVLRVKYEDLTQNPEIEFKNISNFIGKQIDNDKLHSIISSVSNKNIGKGKNTLSKCDVNDLLPLIEESLIEYDYLPNDSNYLTEFSS